MAPEETTTSHPSPSRRYAVTGTLVTDAGLIDDALVAIEGDRIEYAGTVADFTRRNDAGDFPVRMSGARIMPGLIDLHCHGSFGGDFSTSDAPTLRAALTRLHAAGTTTLVASLMSDRAEAMLSAAERIAEFVDDGMIAGIHAEGPFLAPARAGAQDATAFRDPDPAFVDELIAASRGALRTMTFAPERPGADALIEQLVSHGVIPSIGHTDASTELTRQSLDLALEELSSAGFDGYTEIPTVTHLFNGMAPWHHRTPGAAGAALEFALRRRARIEVIGDGHHLHPDTLRMLLLAVPEECLALVTDSTAATGMPDGDYPLGQLRIRRSQGQVHSAEGHLAGSASTLLDAVLLCVEAGVDMLRVLPAVTTVPAAILGLQDEVGALHEGFRADLLVLDESLDLVATIRAGEVLTESP
ncbi:N-acetylglucosamine-6-phosphate deacetylase [Zhihengliuella flava]|uniref:N-acetylglucosamine-6-phosphate deacetylase n=1 Tax=Zhihengliuella flava TaxID=1285193 RepID=A0A931GDN5_9MICC|nr:amidohydrolase family protein [Zhihengliuella flava]MBG6083628.1 N-acetylglucosamine-6-phosphate deacetylase [Zhihengliuella flava]